MPKRQFEIRVTQINPDGSESQVIGLAEHYIRGEIAKSVTGRDFSVQIDDMLYLQISLNEEMQTWAARLTNAWRNWKRRQNASKGAVPYFRF
jgi:hypothetical protein